MSVVALKQPLPDLPTQKLERWKYTPFARAAGKINSFDKISCLNIESENLGSIKYQQDLPSWASRNVKPEKDGGDLALWTINNNSFSEALVIDVPDNTNISMPASLLIDKSSAGHSIGRIAIRVGKNSSLCLLEFHTSPTACVKNTVTQIVLEENATLTHMRVQNDAIDCVHAQINHITQARDSSYKALTLTTGAALSRNQIFVDLQGSNASCSLSGVTMLRASQHGDTTILIEHQAPHCFSSQNYKTVLEGSAHGVFQGKVHVHQVAQKTDGYQLSNALLLSPLAQMDTKPELEIYADDVKCSHGATTGQLDDEPIFYLRSRGLSEAQARALLLKAFLMEPVASFLDATVVSTSEALIDKWLEKIA